MHCRLFPCITLSFKRSLTPFCTFLQSHPPPRQGLLSVKDVPDNNRYTWFKKKKSQLRFWTNLVASTSILICINRMGSAFGPLNSPHPAPLGLGGTAVKFERQRPSWLHHNNGQEVTVYPIRKPQAPFLCRNQQGQS